MYLFKSGLGIIAAGIFFTIFMKIVIYMNHIEFFYACMLIGAATMAVGIAIAFANVPSIPFKIQKG